MKKRFWVDLIMFISALACIITGIMLDFHMISGGKAARVFYKNIHIYSGYLMSILLIVHIAFNANWISNAFKKIVRR